jgi:hypothetical protein
MRTTIGGVVATEIYAIEDGLLAIEQASNTVVLLAPDELLMVIRELQSQYDQRAKHDHTPEEERRIREAALDRTLADSFPASDPPSTDPNPDDDSLIETTPPRAT